MKALIFNSGLGNRVGEFSKTHHKSMLPMPNGETIFGRQIRILKECGIKEFIVTTGPFKEQLEKEANRKDFEELEFTFVENPIYDKTNYIYSMYLASKYLDDDMLFLHGDLVFDKELAKKFILNEAIDMAMVNKALPRPEKDFKGRVENNKILEVSVKIFDDNCYAFQPFYKLCRTTVRAWCDKVAEYVDAGTVSVYAENAMNEIFPELNVKAFSYEHNFIDEIDNMEDHERVTESIRMFDYEQQETYEGKDSFLDVARILKHANVKKPLLVCDAAYNNLFIKEYIESLPYNFIKFSEFNSNPKYEEVVAGRDLFLTEGCDFIISIGGGSTIDTAKNIKLFSAMDSEKNYLEQDKKYNPVKHLAIPTTGGTGSEGNRNSVLYYKGIKQSICHDSILPDYVILEPKMLETLPDYQKKSTMLDALSQCIESMWAVNSCEQSRAYAAEGIKLIMDNLSLYLKGESLDANMAMLRAANYSGKATNLSQTTAPHAMSYKLSSMYNIAHGHAVAICLPHVCQYMLDNMDKTTEGVDSGELRRILETLSELILGEKTKYEELAKQLDFIVSYTGIESPELKSLDDIDELVDSVNLLRLGNNPVTLDRNALKTIYLNVFHKKEDFTDEDEYLDKKRQEFVSGLQKLTLEILKEADEFFKEQGIRYYLGEGTLLGAVRHGGFIPWDDDIDILLPREDYDRLLDLANENKLPQTLYLDALENNPKHWVLGAKLQMTRETQYIQPKVEKLSPYNGPYIDVFPLDYVPKRYSVKQAKQARRIRICRRFLFIKTGYSKVMKGKLHRYIIRVICMFITNRMVQKFAIKEMKKYNHQNKNKFMVHSASYYPAVKETFPKDCFGEPEYISFEGNFYPIPKDADYVLKTIYGMKYMNVPNYRMVNNRKHQFEENENYRER